MIIFVKNLNIIVIYFFQTQPTTMEDKKIDKLLEFFQSLGKAKHEPCGEHWTGKLISHKIQIEIKIIF